jgi:hypothetical protein
MLGWWDAACPVKTDNAKVLATVYKKKGRALIALASWAPEKTGVKLSVDWKSLGLDPKKTILHAPPVEGYQPEATFPADAPIPVEPARGWLIVAEEAGHP